MLVNPLWGAMDFDGNDQWVVVESGTVLATLLNSSISVWINSTVEDASSGVAIYCERGTSGQDIFKLDFAGASASVTPRSAFFTHRDDAGNLTFVVGTSTTNDGRWHHVALTKAGTSAILYIDGVVDKSETLNGDDTFTDPGLESRIGADTGDGAADFIGQIDNVQLYNRTLTPSEVETLAKSRSRRVITNGLVRWYKMDEGKAESTSNKVNGVKDSSDNGIDGTAAGAPTYKGSILAGP